MLRIQSRSDILFVLNNFFFLKKLKLFILENFVPKFYFQFFSLYESHVKDFILFLILYF